MQAWEAIRSYPNAGMLWKILGVALAHQRKDALQALRRAAELMPKDAEALRNLGAALHDRGLWEEALASAAGRPGAGARRTPRRWSMPPMRCGRSGGCATRCRCTRRRSG